MSDSGILSDGCGGEGVMGGEEWEGRWGDGW